MSRRTIALALIVPLMLFALFVGGLMTWHHDTQLYGGEAAQGELIGCTESAEVNCDVVNTSAYSELLGVPIATWSIPFYATILALALLALRGRDGARTIVVGAGVGAVAYSIFLFAISKTELHYVCAWCIRLYGVNAATLVLALVAGRPARPTRADWTRAAALYVAVLVVAVGGERAYRHALTGGGPEVAAAGAKRDRDPKGQAPALTFTVKTETSRDATFSLDPDDAWIGNPKSNVAVVMFGDLECGYCKRASAELSRLETTYGDRVLFVFKHFPMDPQCNPGVKNKKHKDACAAARASVCAQQQGLFWSFHDLTYKNQHQLGDESLKTYALQVGADGQKYDACLATDAPQQVVRHDAEVGASLDIHGTPRIFINGQLYRSGTSAEVMAKAIEVALGASPEDAATAVKTLRGVANAALAPIRPDVAPVQTVAFGSLAFGMDTFEDAIVDGKAVVAKHQVPALKASWFDAKAACEKAGKRLCTEEEWVSACQNARAVDDDKNGETADDMIEGTAYPYGDYHDDGRCWDDKAGDQFRPVYTGEMPGCRTPTGIYDLTGNVEEWVGDTPERAVLLGGAWDTSEDHARCYRRDDTYGAGYASVRTGFRCCSAPK
jgi:protein-disulfide isomerase/uncharacterized membrane protein